ncbi:MAG: hypothetical protein AAB582_00670 [Patescibacteria group bacterium]
MKSEEITAIIDDHAAIIKAVNDEQKMLEDRKRFAAEVEQKLGYKHLKQAVDAEKHDMPADVVLLKTLAALGIRPLDRSSVDRYKAREVRNLINIVTKFFGIPLMLVGGLAIAIVLISNWREPKIEAVIDPWWSLMFGIGLFLTWAEHALIPRRSWSVDGIQHLGSGLSRKSDLLPRELLQLVLRVREALPGIRFLVHTLHREHGPWFRIIDSVGRFVNDPDPFLEVRFGGESYYIAVWDEPGFDGKLMQVD